MSEFQDKARAAMHAMREVFPATPLMRNDHLSAKYDADIWLKREDLSPVRSYKLRGAFNAMRKVEGASAFVCASAGNHAQGMAFMCRHFQVPGVIFMPVTTPQQKIDKTRIFGGEYVSIKLVGDYFDDTLAEAQRHCTEIGGHFLAPFDDDDVIEGQASVGAEIEEDLPELADMIVLPVGGGGLSSGMRSYFGDRVALRFVEPSGGMSLRAAVEAGEPVTLKKVDSFVDGAAVARIGAKPFARLKGIRAEDVLAAPEDRICITMLEMLNVEGIVLEPAGALSVNALEDLRDEIRGKRVICVTSGGNFDFERLPEVKERAQRFAGVKKYFILRLPQRPGALRDFLDMLGPDDDISRFEYLKKSARNFGSVLIGIETKDAANLDALYARMEADGFAYRDITTDPVLAEFLI
ncbi:threonine dehydratase [Pseudooceanicola sediminis]|uniref:L-threonine dehydratase n=1 Tax=Pseudooceanicola sediminis TaxID=2211117 RepID=A0A399J8K1_9RHOB|nr:threonine ammonia-lyase IlvA [Pseudooceanicola sediminis]KAA2315432.1 threonine ammonia-lyase IlvA [Puniceibacterium sp. HSS470]RII40362.1 threonine dehydratase [Pseudooceanicola sediminis]|tara:strand:+ start:58720 stop:59946 length:1227 start_codon:yes stop_codon:yes gene_type:complete